MPLTNLDSALAAVESWQPLLVASIVFTDGSTLRVSSHPLNASEGGVQYGGQDYFGRISSQDIHQIQAMSEQGIDVVPQVTLHLADPDKYLWLNFESASGKGFKGATLELTLVFYDLATGAFSSDSLKRFRGVCSGAQCDDLMLVVTATSLTNVQRRQFPIVPIQRRCPWINPITTEQRAEAGNEDSPYYECGETRDLATAPPCKYTNETCTQSLRRGNITWDPPEGGRSREYVTGQTIDIRNNANEAKYGDFYPMVYGTAWVEPPIMNVVGDGNSTRGECVVCVGEVEDILKVVVNDVEVPPAASISGSPYLVQDPLFRYNVINRGDRDGSPNEDIPYNGAGDPYGNLCAIMFVVPRKVSDAASTPRVRVLVRGPKIRVYTDATTFTKVYTENPIWILLDLLIWTNFTYADIDLASFVTAAAICDESISYEDQNGDTSSHARFACSLALRQRRSAAEIIKGVRAACNAILVPNSSSGKLQVFIKGTLASEQPSAVTGSNDNTAVSSKNRAGTTTNGYAAFHFGDSTITRDDSGRSTLRLRTEPISNTANRVSFGFSDDAMMRAASSLSLVDSSDINRSQQEVAGSMQVDGVPNYDQAVRLARVFLAEQLRGNEEGDTRGTRWLDLQCSFHPAKVRVGHLCLLSSADYQIEDQLVRITKITPSKNYERVTISGHFHNDDWYVDTYGQQPEPFYSNRRRDREARPSYPWAPYVEVPASGDSLYELTRRTFRLQPRYETMADGSALTNLEISGRVPVNDFADLRAPLVQAQGTTASSGGSIAGGGWVYWMAVCGTDAGGKLSPHSALCRVPVTNGGSSNTITVPVISWDPDTTGYVVFAGRSPSSLTYQADGSGTPSTVTLTAFNLASWGVPDGEFDRIAIKVKRIPHGGVFAAQVTAKTSTTITIAGAVWSVNQWVGYDVSLLAIDDNIEIPLYNRTVSANSTDTLTVPSTTGLNVFDLIVMRSKPTLSNGNKTLTDAGWENNLSNDGDGMVASDEVGRLVRIIAGAGRGQARRIASATATSVTVDSDWDGPLDATSRYIIEEPNWLPARGDSTPLTNANPEAEVKLVVPVNNYEGVVLLVMPFTVDGGGHESVDHLTPFREVYLWGRGVDPAGVNEGYFDLTIVDGEVTPDIANGLLQRVDPVSEDLLVNAPAWSGGTMAQGMRLSLRFVQDATGYPVTFDAAYAGLGTAEVDRTPLSRSTLQFRLNPEGEWELEAISLLGP